MSGIFNPRPLIKSIQTGTITLTTEASKTATITSVETANTILLLNGLSSDDTQGTDANGFTVTSRVRIALTNGTTVTATRGSTSATGNTVVVAFTVIEFHAGVIKSIQRGTVSYGASGSSTTATITSVDTAKSFVTALGYSGNFNVQAAKHWPRVELTNATTVTFTSGLTITADITVSYEVVEFLL